MLDHPKWFKQMSGLMGPMKQFFFFFFNSCICMYCEMEKMINIEQKHMLYLHCKPHMRWKGIAYTHLDQSKGSWWLMLLLYNPANMPTWRIIPLSKWLITTVSKPPK